MARRDGDRVLLAAVGRRRRTVGLHLSSAGGRPVAVEVARIGARPRRSCSRRRGRGRRARDAAATRRRTAAAGRPRSRSTSTRRGARATTRSSSRSTSTARSGATTRSSSCARRARRRAILLALATNTWHAYNDFGGPEPLHRRHAGVAAAADGAGLPPQAAGHGPPGHRHGRTRSADRRARRLPPAQPPVAAAPARPAGPTGSCRSSSGPSARATRSTCARTPTSRTTPSCCAARYLLPLGRPRRVLVGAACATPSRRFIARGGNAAFFSGNTSLWQVRLEGDDHDAMVGYKGLFKDDPVFGTDRAAGAHDDLVRSCSSAGPRTT